MPSRDPPRPDTLRQLAEKLGNDPRPSPHDAKGAFAGSYGTRHPRPQPDVEDGDDEGGADA